MSRTNAKRPAKKAALRDDLEAQRQRLFQAHAIVEVTRHAITTQLEGLDESAIVNALAVAGGIVDDVASALELAKGGAS